MPIYYTKWEKACSGKLKKNAANAANFSTCTIIVTQHLKMTVDIIYAAAPITLLRQLEYDRKLEPLFHLLFQMPTSQQRVTMHYQICSEKTSFEMPLGHNFRFLVFRLLK